MALDLKKQIGPLPLGAWIAVVGVGLGIAYWNYRNNASAPVEEVEDTSGVPGVGDGSVGGWTPTTPPPSNGPVGGDISTNEDWARAAINHLIALNYSPTMADSAIRKYITGTKLSVSETALVAIALTRFGSPPQPLPPEEGDPVEPPPGGGSGGTARPKATIVSATRIGPGDARLSVQWEGTVNSWRVVSHLGRTPGGITIASGSGRPSTITISRNAKGGVLYLSVKPYMSAGFRHGGAESPIVRVQT